jgi:hypothetical protein
MARRSNVAPEGLETRRRALNSQLLRSHPAIDPEETRNPVAQEGPETFSFVPRSARATGDEPRSPLVSHYSIVVVSRSASISASPEASTTRRIAGRPDSSCEERSAPSAAKPEDEDL